jgi:GNAT superfamily N-acetyltransferase
LAAFTPGTDHPMRNYAIPDDDARPSSVEVDTLVHAFEQRGLKPRLEYAADAAPRLEAILVAAGFEVEGLLPLMTCHPGEARPLETPRDFVVALAESDRDHAESMVVAGDAYGEPGPPPGDASVAARQPMTAAGGAVVLARHRDSREPAGSGLFPVPQAGVSELAAVGTRAAFRNRGVAVAVTARLIQAAFDCGLELLWLTPEDAQAERICARAGFAFGGGQMMHISKPRQR